MNKYQSLSFIVALGVLLFSANSMAQVNVPIAEEPAATEADVTAERLNQLEASLTAQQKAIEDMKAKEAELEEKQEASTAANEELTMELESAREEIEMVAMIGTEDDSNEKRLSIYGFFDASFYNAFFEHDNSILQTQDAPKSTFVMSNINLYLKSEMTQSLEALIETRLSFAPLGHESNLPIDEYVYDANGNRTLYSDLVDSTEYERVDTTIGSPISAETYRYGSIDVVRAYLDWKPRDWINFRVGRYLTPYGIWNEEHASTVLTGVYYPNLMNWNLVPASQMGIQLYGNQFLNDIMNLKYAFTVSNGRGPIDTVMDLDDNKAVGLRAQGIWNSDNWRLSIGGYGYYGKYSNVSRRPELYLNSDFSPREIDGSSIGATVRTEQQYKEWIATADLSLELFGVKVFGEYVFRRVNQVKPKGQLSDYQFVQNGDIGDRDEPSYISQSVYGILAYTLPLDKAIAPVTITPYVGYDWVVPQDTYDWLKQRTVRYGLNVKPSPFVALKAEGIIDYYHPRVGGRMNTITAQVAVSF